jgi:hypothetical protein
MLFLATSRESIWRFLGMSTTLQLCAFWKTDEPPDLSGQQSGHQNGLPES